MNCVRHCFGFPFGTSKATVSIDTAFMVSAKLSLFEGFDLLDSVALGSERIIKANFLILGYFSHSNVQTCNNSIVYIQPLINYFEPTFFFQQNVVKMNIDRRMLTASGKYQYTSFPPTAQDIISNTHGMPIKPNSFKNSRNLFLAESVLLIDSKI